MKLIVWLWNPWKQYEETRHNLGFLFLDYLLKNEKFDNFREEVKFKWFVSTWLLNWEKTILLKPCTYMNLSWESLRKVVDFYKIPIENIIVIYDDISMDFWKIRFRTTWSAWWHNWVKSLITHLWDNWNRIKVWVWFNSNFDVSDWVLSKFTIQELSLLEVDVFKKVKEVLLKNF